MILIVYVSTTVFIAYRRFIAAFTSTRHLSLSCWFRSIQSILSNPTSWISILILSSHLRLGLPSGLFPPEFPTNTLYTPLPSAIRGTCPAHLILLDFITRTILGEEYRSLSTAYYLIYIYYVQFLALINVASRCCNNSSFLMFFQ